MPSSSSTSPLEAPTYEVALKSPQPKYWDTTIQDELASLHDMGVWVLEPLPPGHKPVTYKWIFKTKLNIDGFVARY